MKTLAHEIGSEGEADTDQNDKPKKLLFGYRQGRYIFFYEVFVVVHKAGLALGM